jgi:predicted transcriptional regulator
MVQYRTQVRIIADLLKAAKDENQDGEGVGITTLIRKGNMPYSRLTKLVSELVGAGLLKQLEKDRTTKYVITENGLKFLEAYKNFEEFAESFGLRL